MLKYKRQIAILILIFIIGLLLNIFLPPKVIVYENVVEEPQPVEVIEVSEPLVGKEHYLDKINEYASKHGVSSFAMIEIMDCENAAYDPNKQSGHRYNAGQISRHPDWGNVGDREKSFGLVQIHLPAKHTWTGELITEEMAKDPDIAIEFLAYHLSQGHARWWTCSELKGIL